MPHRSHAPALGQPRSKQFVQAIDSLNMRGIAGLNLSFY